MIIVPTPYEQLVPPVSFAQWSALKLINKERMVFARTEKKSPTQKPILEGLPHTKVGPTKMHHDTQQKEWGETSKTMHWEEATTLERLVKWSTPQ